MDEATLKAAQKAEDAIRRHKKECSEGCAELGDHQRGDTPGPWRCSSGLELWDAWIAFRPSPLRGDRIAPDRERLEHYIVERVEKIGPYEIAYLLQDASAEKGVKNWAEHLAPRYMIYVDGKREGSVWKDVSLDTLLLVAIEFRTHGKHSGAAYYAGKVLGLSDAELGE